MVKRTQSIPGVAIPPELPIAEEQDRILRALSDHPVLIIAGETGSGKTTQIPKLCLQAGLGHRGRIGCTQPRRIAAQSVSRRIAEELKVPWGGLVGSAIRFQDRTSPETRIKVMTDGILLNEIQRDPQLGEYEAIIVDEAHERSLNIDFIIGFLRKLRVSRPDLKIIITSATIDTERFSEAFGGAPVIEVSGRMYPVVIEYRPLDQPDSEDHFYENIIEATVGIAGEIMENHPPGDILVFMSGERSIREAKDLLEARRFRRTEVLPLFGRLSSDEQQRIFSPSRQRRIIVATNIAETSVTIPRIRYVIDTGQARISRYSPHTRTLRLPIEPISRSSARQRAGRCGRMQDGRCFRLYSEEDFLARPLYTPPEIQRSNLASVILRLLSMNIGDIENFPFLDPPDPRAIRGGYNLLRELKAVDASNALTDFGHQLSRISVDPTIATMLLHAPRETCQRDILAIASGMSIRDPRERPSEKEALADRAHKRFLHPQSDFLTLLNIWNTFRKKERSLSRNQLKKWCREHFLSYLRMREWKDIHRQLVDILKDLKAYRVHDLETDPVGIHRTILTGLLGNVAHRDTDNWYHATHSRKVMLFPGSALFDPDSKPRKKQSRSIQPPVRKSKTPEWILCGEWVETSRLFARTVARIEPRWILDLGKHLFRESVSEPTWDRKQGRVVAKKRILLYGLEIEVKRVSYARINPDEARAIFIQSALVEEDLENPPHWMEHNRKVREKVESWQTRTRRLQGRSLDERIYAHFERLLGEAPIGSLGDFDKWFKENPGKKESFPLSFEQLIESEAERYDPEAFPTRVEVGDDAYPINYQFQPGEEKDGATLRIPFTHFAALQEGMLDWLVPGYIEDKVNALLRSLPKEYRIKLHPLAEKTEYLVRTLKPGPEPLAAQLQRNIRAHFRLEIPDRVWESIDLPEHLKLRVEMVDEDRKTVAGSRQWRSLEAAYRETMKKRARSGKGNTRLALWVRAAQKWERRGLQSWSFGDLPEKIELGEFAEMPVIAWPGLAREEEGRVGVRLFRSREESVRWSRPAVRLLAEIHCARDLAWLKKDLKILQNLGPLVSPLANPEEFHSHARQHLLRHLFHLEPLLPLQEERFTNLCKSASSTMKGLAHQFHDRLKAVLEFRNSLAARKQAYPGMDRDLARIVPPDFLQRIEYRQLINLRRYLKGLEVRADRFAVDPEKDVRKARGIEPLQRRLGRLLKKQPDEAQIRTRLNRLFWLLEEYRVSVFAQELGTAEKVSEKRIHSLLLQLEE